MEGPIDDPRSLFVEQRSSTQPKRMRRKSSAQSYRGAPEIPQLTLKIDVQLRERPLTSVSPPRPGVGKGIPVIQHGVGLGLHRSDPDNILRPVGDFLDPEIVDLETRCSRVERVAVSHSSVGAVELQPGAKT